MPKRTSKADAHFDALFGARQGEQLAGGFKLIPRAQIARGAQPRHSFPAAEISELAASIAQLRERGEGIAGTGLLQPLLVTENGSGYRLIAGERRYRATEEIGLELLPAIVVETDESGILLAQLVENLQRRDLPPLEEARGLDQLMSEQKLSLREAARLLGKDRGYIENRRRLLKMGPDLQEMVSVRTDTLQHARLIHPVAAEGLRRELIAAAMDGAGEREIRRRIEAHDEAHSTAHGESLREQPTDSAAGSDTSLDSPNSPRGVQVPTAAMDALSVRTDSAQASNEYAPNEHAQPAAPSDPLFSVLRLAVTGMVEFGQRIQARPLTRHDRQAIEQELELLKGQIARIETMLTTTDGDGESSQRQKNSDT